MRIPLLDRHPRARSLAVEVARQWPWVRPRRRVDSAREWIDRAARHAGWYRSHRSHWYELAHPGEIRAYAPPAMRDDDRQYFRGVLSRSIAASGVFFFDGAYLFSDQGAVISKNNELFTEFTHNFGVSSIERAPIYRPFAALDLGARRRAEWVALLAAPEGKNYYHWTFDVLPRLALLERFRPQIEQYALPAGLSPVQLEALALLGVEPSQILPLEEGKRIYCERLLVPSLPGSEGNVPRWAIEFLRDLARRVPPSPAPLPERIYLTRGPGAMRPILNEPELIAALEQRGFTTVDASRLSFAEQVNVFREAKVIVAAHGAGLANTVYAERATVIELFSVRYFRPDCFFTLASELGHQYRYWADHDGTREPWASIVVDVDAVTAIVDESASVSAAGERVAPGRRTERFVTPSSRREFPPGSGAPWATR